MAVRFPRLFLKYIVYLLVIYTLLAVIYLLGGFDNVSPRPDHGHQSENIILEQSNDRPKSPTLNVVDGNSIKSFEKEIPSGEKISEHLLSQLRHQSDLVLEMQKKIMALEETHKQLPQITKSENIAEESAAPPSHEIKSTNHVTHHSLDPNIPTPDGRSSWSIPFNLGNDRQLPVSSVYCHGSHRDNRTCSFKNLYYNPSVDQFFMIRDGSSVYVNFPKEEDRSQMLLDMTSLSNHGMFMWNVQDVPVGHLEATIKNLDIQVVPERTFMLMRFHSGNIMHAIHDDFIGLYHHLKMYNEPVVYKDGSIDPFRKDHHILFLEGAGEGGYGHIFKLLSDYPIKFKENLNKNSIMLFPDAIVGQSKLVNWYHYGFAEPQGPIPNKHVNGAHLREVAAYILKQLSIPTWNLPNNAKNIAYMHACLESHKNNHDPHHVPNTTEPSEDANIVIFGRKHDRLLVNEEALASSLQEILPKLRVIYLRNEDHTFIEQLRILKSCVLAIGMHGSLLIMSLFLPPGSLLLELYPYAVPGDNYSPYKHLCSIPGMNLHYRNWLNTHTENNIPHPEYPKHYGGLTEFSEELRNKVLNTLSVPSHLCCSDPYWLFRIYQDTKVHIPEAISKIRELVNESFSVLYPNRQQKHAGEHFVSGDDMHQLYDMPFTVPEALPSSTSTSAAFRSSLAEEIPVFPAYNPFSIVPAPIADAGLSIARIPEGLRLAWQCPWNVPKSHIVKYGIWCHQSYTETFVPSLPANDGDIAGRKDDQNNTDKKESAEISIQNINNHRSSSYNDNDNNQPFPPSEYIFPNSFVHELCSKRKEEEKAERTLEFWIRVYHLTASQELKYGSWSKKMVYTCTQEDTKENLPHINQQHGHASLADHSKTNGNANTNAHERGL